MQPQNCFSPSLWSRLQELPRIRQYPSDYLLLLSALDMGWKIVEPVFFDLPSEHQGRGTYLFILTHDLYLATRQLNLLQSAEVDQFIQKHQLTVQVHEQR